jgi:LytS/YehU family sensor histidine kinase
MARMYLDSVKILQIENLSREKQKALLDYELRLAVETNKSNASVSRLLNDIYEHQDAIYKRKSKIELLALTDANDAQKVLLKEKQASEIENLKLENRFIILLVTIITLGLVAMLLYRQRKLRFEKQELQMQQRLLRSQMNPHFTFNTLAAIQNKFKTDKERASSYLLKFSRLLRVILENSMQNYVQLEKELESLRKYMDLQLFRFPDKFNYTLKLVNLEEDELIFIPPMLIQPFVENSIEHGFVGIYYQGEIKISLEKVGEFIKCTIEDNGTGISEKLNQNKKSTSIQLISEYIERATKSKIGVYNKDKTQDKTGVIISFLIPSKPTEND